jgi:hypothetical protein
LLIKVKFVEAMEVPKVANSTNLVRGGSETSWGNKFYCLMFAEAMEFHQVTNPTDPWLVEGMEANSLVRVFWLGITLCPVCTTYKLVI